MAQWRGGSLGLLISQGPAFHPGNPRGEGGRRGRNFLNLALTSTCRTVMLMSNLPTQNKPCIKGLSFFHSHWYFTTVWVLRLSPRLQVSRGFVCFYSRSKPLYRTLLQGSLLLSQYVLFLNCLRLSLNPLIFMLNTLNCGYDFLFHDNAKKVTLFSWHFSSFLIWQLVSG